MRTQAKVVSEGDEVATSDEVAQALAALDITEIARLNLIAKLRARYAPGFEWRDLLHDAIDKALDGTRKWPRRLPFLLFMREVMRSLASEHRRKWQFGPITIEADLATRADQESILTTTASDCPGPERDIYARQMISQILSLFDGDAAALAILDGLAKGLEPHEIQAQADLTAKQYASAQRRIRRCLVRAYPEGVEHE